ncbi:MAG: hypothetical protein ABEK17_01475 [Candidatus Aenigmatarchaeota archaeon]
MGYARVELIPPAVLHMNPGVTREEYLELLENIPFTLAEFYDSDKDWDDVETGEYSLINDGLEELGGILNLSFTNEYREFQSEERDENDLVIESPRKEYDCDEEVYRVLNHRENEIIEDGIVELSVADGLEEGDVYWYGYNYKVKDIVEEENTGSDDMHTYYDYKINALVFRKDYDVDVFESREELWEKWPQFHPDNIFDWFQDRGNFRDTNNKFHPSKFIWKQADGKYYLDEETFEEIPVSWAVSNMDEENKDMYGAYVGYTDFIITLEGLKRKAWKLFVSGGMQHLKDFFKDYPEAKREHERAVWDFYSSEHAKEKDMSNKDLLRYRLMNDWAEDTNNIYSPGQNKL